MVDSALFLSAPLLTTSTRAQMHKEVVDTQRIGVVIGVERTVARNCGVLSREQHGVVADVQPARLINPGVQTTSGAALMTHAFVVTIAKPAGILKTRNRKSRDGRLDLTETYPLARAPG